MNYSLLDLRSLGGGGGGGHHKQVVIPSKLSMGDDKIELPEKLPSGACSMRIALVSCGGACCSV